LKSPRARVWLGLWIAVIVACVVPWIGWQDHSHWTRIGWVPFSSPPVRLRDIVINTVLYVPFGLFCHRALRPHWSGRAGFAMLWAIVLSVSTEASQIYSHGRFPSATDVMTNVIGAGLGVMLAKARFGPRVREIKTPGV